MNQINQNEMDQVPVPMDLILNEKTAGSINYLLLGLRYAIKSIVKEAVELLKKSLMSGTTKHRRRTKLSPQKNFAPDGTFVQTHFAPGR